MATHIERYMREGEVLQLTTLSHATLYREIKAGRFPGPVRLSPGRVGWRASELETWMASPGEWRKPEPQAA